MMTKARQSVEYTASSGKHVSGRKRGKAWNIQKREKKKSGKKRRTCSERRKTCIRKKGRESVVFFHISARVH